LPYELSAASEPAYAYLLGQYLGDGHIGRLNRVYRLRITMDARYVQIIDECRGAMEILMPGQHAYLLRRSENCAELSMYSKHWPCYFPQHGPGRKHNRRIFLSDWQAHLVQRDPKPLIRGLIHSDGCRVVANDRGIASVRYHFSNRSDDIKSILCDALDRLAIPWTRPDRYQIAVYRKAAVAVLDTLVGPKR
jgi:hypothetical protein